MSSKTKKPENSLTNQLQEALEEAGEKLSRSKETATEFTKHQLEKGRNLGQKVLKKAEDGKNWLLERDLEDAKNVVSSPSALGVACATIGYFFPQTASALIIMTAVEAMYQPWSDRQRDKDEVFEEEAKRGAINLGTLAGVAIRYSRFFDNFIPLAVVGAIFAVVLETRRKEAEIERLTFDEAKQFLKERGIDRPIHFLYKDIDREYPGKGSEDFLKSDLETIVELQKGGDEE